MSGRLISPRQTPKRGTRGNFNPPSESPIPVKKDNKSIDQQLGPEWSQEDITTFVNAVRDGRHDWENIARGMHGRTSDNVKNLYNMQKDYLALNEASSLGLFTILKSIYNMAMPSVSHDDDTDTGATRRSTRSRAASNPKEIPKTPSSKPQPVRKTRKKLFSDSDDGSSPTRTTSTSTRTPSPPPKSTPSRKRKTPSKHDSPPSTPRTPSSALNTSIPATPDSQLPLKLRGKFWKQNKSSPHKTDGTPKSTPSHTLPANGELAASQKILHKRLVSFLKSHNANATQHEVPLSPAGRWAVYEWFYADVDRVYFQINEFQECLNELGLSKIRKLTRVEWAHVRSAMGKPRRLSTAFLRQERNKLYNTRENVRLMRTGETPAPKSTADAGIIPADIPSSLSLATPVLVYHLKALKKGVVQHAENDGSRYRVQLDGHSNAIWIRDVDIMSLYADDNEEEDGTPQPLRNKEALLSSATKRRKFLDMTPANGTSRNGAPPIRPYSKEEMRNIAALSGLLERKDKLVSELTAMNNQAEKMLASSQDYPSWFQQRYAFLIVQLDGVNQQLEPTLLRLHATRTSPVIAPPIARNSYADISMLDFGESSNWSENSINESKQRSQHLVNEYLQHKYSGPPSVRDYVCECVCLLLQLQACANYVRSVGPEEASNDIFASLDYMITTLRPKSDENMQLFSEIEQSVNMLKTRLTTRTTTHT